MTPRRILRRQILQVLLAPCILACYTAVIATHAAPSRTDGGGVGAPAFISGTAQSRRSLSFGTTADRTTLFLRSTTPKTCTPIVASRCYSPRDRTSRLHLGSEWYGQAGKGDGEGDDDDEDGAESIDLSDQDWRAFRAKLVMTEPSTDEASTGGAGSGPATTEEEEDEEDPDDLDGIGQAFKQQRERFNIVENPTNWAYDSGNVIERGAVILGGVEQDFGFGLRQQYFHKAAILVLEHEEKKFTKGIILNRPSDRMLADPDNPTTKWRVWFGGDVQSLDSVMPDITCLHSLKSEAASDVSAQVMKDMQWTTFDNAKKLVKDGDARPSDFWVFCGYAGWAPGQLMDELERKSWYMVATDSQTLLQDLARQGATSDPREAGLDTWELLMKMIGRGETAKETVGEFDDLMLKEWAREHLLSENVSSPHAAGKKKAASASSSSPLDLTSLGPIDALLKRATGGGPTKGEAGGEDTAVSVGSLVRASSAERSPFLLSRQEFHKSVVLVLSDDDNLTTGVILNQPAATGLDIQIADKASGAKKVVTIPLRFGGEYRVRGQTQDLLWLHRSQKMRDLNVGSQLGESSKGIWTCTPEQATTAIGQGIAKPEDFMVVSGVSVWMKGDTRMGRGMQGEIAKGNFEVVPPDRVAGVWEKLLSQELLSGVTLHKSLAIGNDAWRAAGDERNGNADSRKKHSASSVMDGIGDGYDEDDDSTVFKSNVMVSTLSDDALRSWVATFLLGIPNLH